MHHARKVKEWLCGKEARIELVFLPSYAPESNPDEYLNRDFKTALRTDPISRNREELLEKAHVFHAAHRQLAKPRHGLLQASRCRLRSPGYLRAGLIVNKGETTRACP